MRNLIVYRNNKFFYIEGIEEPKPAPFEPMSMYNKHKEKFKERLSTEGVEVETDTRTMIALFRPLEDKYIKNYSHLKNLDWIYTDKLEVKEGKAYL